MRAVTKRVICWLLGHADTAKSDSGIYRDGPYLFTTHTWSATTVSGDESNDE